MDALERIKFWRRREKNNRKDQEPMNKVLSTTSAKLLSWVQSSELRNSKLSRDSKKSSDE